MSAADTTLKKVEFAVEVTCDSCVEKVSSVLKDVPDIKNFKVDLTNQSVVIDSTLETAQLYKILKGTGYSVTLRGQGTTSGENLGAAVSLLRSRDASVMGVVRFVQTGDESCSIEATVDGLSPGKHHGIHVHTYGDIRNDGENAGPHWNPKKLSHSQPGEEKGCPGDLGNVEASERGRGVFRYNSRFLRVWEIIGRSVCIDEQQDLFDPENDGSNDKHLVCGVIARSAGLFENSKKICQCDGTSIWEEDTSKISWTREAAAVEKDNRNG